MKWHLPHIFAPMKHFSLCFYLVQCSVAFLSPGSLVEHCCPPMTEERRRVWVSHCLLRHARKIGSELIVRRDGGDSYTLNPGGLCPDLLRDTWRRSWWAAEPWVHEHATRAVGSRDDPWDEDGNRGPPPPLLVKLAAPPSFDIPGRPPPDGNAVAHVPCPCGLQRPDGRLQPLSTDTLLHGL